MSTWCLHFAMLCSCSGLGHGPGQELACIPVQVATPLDSGKNKFSQMMIVYATANFKILKWGFVSARHACHVLWLFGTTQVEKCFPESKGNQAGKECSLMFFAKPLRLLDPADSLGSPWVTSMLEGIRRFNLICHALSVLRGFIAGMTRLE